MKRILITGGGGFIGHHFTDHILRNTDWDIVVMWKSNKKKVEDLESYKENKNRVTFWHVDLSNGVDSPVGNLDYIVHFASEVNVDRSLINCISFVKSNVLGTAYLLEWIKEYYSDTKTCIFTTDEVLGAAPEGVYYTENTIRRPSNPYAATKGSMELLAYSFAHSFGLPIFMVRSMNFFGERQDQDKFIPRVVKSTLENKEIILHGKDKNNVASRHWIYVKDVVEGVFFLLDKAAPNEVYHVVGKEMDVYHLARLVYKAIKGEDLPQGKIKFVDFHSARPGHDKRYSLSGKKLKKMGWVPRFNLEEDIQKVAIWFAKNQEWIKVK